MSKITIEEILNTVHDYWIDGVTSVATEITHRIEQREAEWEHTADLQKKTYDDEVELLKAQYAELVEAVGNWKFWLNEGVDPGKSSVQVALIKAYDKINKPPSPADRLDELFNEWTEVGSAEGIIKGRAIAAELREGEK